jgi:hypothetical protein
MHRAEHSPVPFPSPKWAAPAAHGVSGGPETSSGKRQAHLGHRQGHRTPALLGQEWPQPVGHPSSPIQPQTAPSPDSEPATFRGIRARRTSPAAPTGARSMDAPVGAPSRIGRDARPATALRGIARRSRPHPTTIRIMEMTLHKRLETRLKVRGINTAERNILRTIKHEWNGERDRSGEEGEVKDKAPT